MSEVTIIGVDVAKRVFQLPGTLLRNSADERISPFPRRIYPMAFVTGMPRVV